MTCLIVVPFKHLNLFPSHHYRKFKFNYLSPSLLCFKIYEDRSESALLWVQSLLKHLHVNMMKFWNQSPLNNLFNIILNVFLRVSHSEGISHSLGSFWSVFTWQLTIQGKKICRYKIYILFFTVTPYLYLFLLL